MDIDTEKTFLKHLKKSPYYGKDPLMLSMLIPMIIALLMIIILYSCSLILLLPLSLLTTNITNINIINYYYRFKAFNVNATARYYTSMISIDTI